MKFLSEIRLAAVLLAFAAIAQPAFAGEDDDDASFGTRVSAAADFKAFKGFHLTAAEELRFSGIGSFDRTYSSVEASYKAFDWLKAGVTYTFIGVSKDADTEHTDNWTDIRHRVSFDLTESLRFRGFKFSLRERWQLTHKTRDINVWQQPQTSQVFRTRLKVSCPLYFQGFGLEPYAAAEARFLLNGAEWSEEALTSSFKTATYLGHTDKYLSRMRGQLGVECKFALHHAIDLYCLFDNVSDKVIDSNAEGTKLKAMTYTAKNNIVSLGIGYVFSF